MDAATIGFSVIGVLQIANLAWTGIANNKIDRMVSNDQCLERKASCGTAKDLRIKVVETKMNHHVHNGDGKVKYEAFETP